MILVATKSFEFQGRWYKPGDLVKMGTTDAKTYEEKVTTQDKFTKQIVTHETKEVENEPIKPVVKKKK